MRLIAPAALLAGTLFMSVACDKAGAPSSDPSAPMLKSPVTYKDIDGLFQAKCADCHRGGKSKGGLSLASYADLMKGGKDGPAVIAGNPKVSLLVAYLKGIMTPRMPAKAAPLADSDIQAISDWIQAGAKE